MRQWRGAEHCGGQGGEKRGVFHGWLVVLGGREL
jgi:hypothetical protein